MTTPTATGRRWSAVLARLGMPTGDKRILTPGGITNRELPLPLMWQRTTGDGHSGAVVVGAIETINYTDDMVTATGRFLDVRGSSDAERQTEAGVTGPSIDLFDDIDIQEVQTLIEAGVIGPNVVDDMDDIEYLYDEENGMVVITSGRIAGATLVAIPAFADVGIQISHPVESMTASVRTEGWGDMPISDAAREWDGDAAAARVAAWAGVDDENAGPEQWSRYARAFLHKDDEADPMTRGAYGYGIADVVDGTLTIVPAGVFAAAAAVQGARGADPGVDADAMRTVLSGIYRRLDRVAPWDEEDMGLVASAAAEALPPVQYFGNPSLPMPTPLTVMRPDEDGIQRVFGHIAEWDVCHTGLPGCVTAPSSQTDYAYFTTGAERTRDGVDVPVGVLTVGGGHADPGMGFRPAAAHYDDIGTAVASVRAGEDEHGIWVCGIVIPGTPEPMVRELLRHAPSCDWRSIGGSLELIAVCAVNAQGFPVKRPMVKFSLGRQISLIASSRMTPVQEFASAIPKHPTVDLDEQAIRKARAAWMGATIRLKGR